MWRDVVGTDGVWQLILKRKDSGLSPRFTRHRVSMTTKGIEALKTHLKLPSSSDWIKRLEMLGGGMTHTAQK